jgi:hypothetical protein
MNRKLIFPAILAGLLVCSLAFVSCNDGTGDPTDSILDNLGLDRAKIREKGVDTRALAGAKSGDYIVIGVEDLSGSMASFGPGLNSQPWSGSITPVGGTNIYATRTTAVDMFNYCLNNMSIYGGGGWILSNYGELQTVTSPIGNPIPPALSSALAGKESEVPITGFFQFTTINGSISIVAFFVARIN